MWNRRVLAASVAAGVLVLAGCGNGTETGDDGSAAQSVSADIAEREERAAELSESVLTFTATTVEGEQFDAAELAGRPAVF